MAKFIVVSHATIIFLPLVLSRRTSVGAEWTLELLDHRTINSSQRKRPPSRLLTIFISPELIASNSSLKEVQTRKVFQLVSVARSTRSSIRQFLIHSTFVLVKLQTDLDLLNCTRRYTDVLYLLMFFFHARMHATELGWLTRSVREFSAPPSGD